MNQKKFIYGLIVAIAAVSIGTVTYSAQADKIETQIVQTISVSSADLPLHVLEKDTKFAIVGEVVKVKPVVYTNPDRAAEKANNRIPGLVIIDKEILSDVTLKVEEDLFEEYKGKFITVRIQGGETPQQITKHEGYDTFRVGERVIVFVGNEESYNVSKDHYSIIGAKQGTIQLDGRTANPNPASNEFEENIKNEIKSLRVRD